MSSVQSKTLTILLAFISLLLAVGTVHAVPYNGDIFTYHQPDDSTFQIKLYGDEFYAVAETLDGYTLVRDPKSGMFCYARLSNDGNSFVSTGVPVGTGKVASAGLQKGIRISHHSRNIQSRAARKKFGVDDRGKLLPSLRSLLRPETVTEEGIQPLASATEDAIQPEPPKNTTTGTRVGLVLLAQFPDRPSDVVINRSQVDAYCNDPDYSEFANATSVFGYFHIQSDGVLRYNSIVTAYFTTAQNRSYYTDASIPIGTRAQELINEGLQILKTNGFDFTKSDADGNGILDGVNIFYAGDRVNSWAEGLWPHKWSSSWEGLAGEGVSTSFQYQISNMGSELSLGTYCHENGHMICAFPDLYSYSGNAAEINNYSLMSSSGNKHPVNVDAYLKIHAGWADVVNINSGSHLRGAVEVNKNTFYRFQNPTESREYFLLSMRTNSGYEGIYGGSDSAVNPTNGLVIWHAREHGSNTDSSIFTADSPAADYTKPYELMVVEANPNSATTPWYDDPSPGSNDGYHSGDVSEISDNTTPALKFWNTETGRTADSNMHVHTISAQGNTMTFTIGTGAITGSATIGMTSTFLSPECEFGSNAETGSFAVFNSNAGTLNYTITDNVSWLSVSPASGSSTTEADLINIIYDTDSMSDGTYHGTITVTDGGATNSPQTIDVNLTINAQPTIGLNTSTVTKALSSGSSATGGFVISNTGGGTLEYTLTESASWLGMATSSGTVAAEEDTIDLTFDATGMFAGTYTTDIAIISANATNSPQSVTVTMNLTGEISVISPNGSEILWQGNKQDIIWETDDGVTCNIKIDLYKNGSLDSTIISSTSNDSIFTWNIPDSQAIGSDYKIRISSVEEPEKYAESSSDFTISAPPALISIPYSESFESDLGDWVQSSNDAINWTRDSGGTPSSGTGPGSAQDGFWYIYTEASSPNYPSKSAILYSYFDLRTATAPLLSFNYHMYGAGMGSLIIRASTDQKNWTDLFSLSGDQGNSWIQVHDDLSAFSGRVISLQISGTTGASYTSDMALDALTISEAAKTLTYSTDTFTEDAADDGSISNNISIILAGDTFNSTVVSGGHITAANVPTGLTEQFVRNSSTQITMTLTGNAANHDNANDISDLQVTFADGAFTSANASTVTGNVKNLIVDYIQAIQTVHTVNASVDANGSLNTTSLSVNHGSTASFTVTPATGYTTNSTIGGDCPAGSWNGDIYTTGSVIGACSVSFTHSLLSIINHTVNSSILGGNGTIDPAGNQTIAHGMTTQFTLNPTNGFNIESIAGSCGGTLSGNSFTTNTIVSDCTVFATFSAQQYTLNIVFSGKGSGTVTSVPAGIDCGMDCGELYDDSTPVTLFTTPDADSKFTGWSGDTDCLDGMVTMTDDRHCTANFHGRFPWLIFRPLINFNSQ